MDYPHPCCDPDTPAGGGPCPCPDPGAVPPAAPAERNLYFTGKYMTARDFTAEQLYFLGRHRLHQRVLHGWGIVCGLDVVPHPDPTCGRNGWVVITPGIAVDCYGRELTVFEPLPVRLPDVYPANVRCGDEPAHSQKQERGSGALPVPKDPPPPDQWFLLGLKYGELCVEPVPVLADATGCEPRTSPNRVREVACPRYLSAEDGAGCWGPPPTPCAPCPVPVPPKIGDIPASLAEVLKPLCDAGCDGLVPLALCWFPASGEGGEVEVPEEYLNDPQWYIDMEGRRYLPGPLNPRQMTHICDVNWRHGANTSLDDLGPDAGRPQGQEEPARAQGYPRGGDDRRVTLWVQFDRPLSWRMPSSEETYRVVYDGPPPARPGVPERPRPEPAEVRASDEIGFYMRILHLHFETDEGEFDALPWLREAKVTLSEGRTRLAYSFPLWALEEKIRNNPNPVLRLTLDCDFLTDQWGRAVDGDHLHGRLTKVDDGKGGERPLGPSGDGTEGGMFESWFRLTGLHARGGKSS